MKHHERNQTKTDVQMSKTELVNDSGVAKFYHINIAKVTVVLIILYLYKLVSM